ncbi:MAG: hypothetical protein AAF400_01770 [Bacteroidota bacterium]
MRFHYELDQWRAEVSSQLDAFFRRAVLPVVCSREENPTSSLEVFSRYPSWYSQRRIHVLDGKVAPALGEVVYPGELGLQGGGELWIPGPEVHIDNVAEEGMRRCNIPQGKHYKRHEVEVKRCSAEGWSYSVEYVEAASKAQLEQYEQTGHNEDRLSGLSVHVLD